MPDDPNTAQPEPTAQEPQSVAVQTPQTVAAAQPASVPDPTPSSTPPQVDFTSVIPEAYKDKPYMKEVTSFDKLFQDFDNAQSLIGQRQEGLDIPGADATPEQIQAYVDKIKPESVEAYTFPETEYSKKFGRDEAFQGQMKELFHKAGLQPWQVNTLTEGYDAALFGKANEMASSAENQAADFEKLAEGHFGEAKEEKLRIANEILKANTPEAFKEHLAKLPNESLMVLSGVLNNVYDKFMKEDDLNTGGKGTATDTAALQEEARQLMADPAYKDFRNPKHDQIVKRVNELYDQIGNIKK
jgi:hypothetical protein